MAIAGLLITSAFVVQRVKGLYCLGFSQRLYLPGFWALHSPPQRNFFFALPQIPLDLFGPGNHWAFLPERQCSSTGWLLLFVFCLLTYLTPLAPPLRGVRDARAGYIGPDGERRASNLDG